MKMSLPLVGTEFFHAEGQTHRDRQMDKHYEDNSRFSQFCEKRLKTLLILFRALIAAVMNIQKAQNVW